jgi:RNA 2',3'-cyclic 3'-phosphodiesterase
LSDERARLFAALELPGAASQALARWGELTAAGRPALRLVRGEGLHVTLCFLGSRGIGELPRIGEACEAVAGQGPVELSFGRALCLPPRRPRVLAVALDDPSGALGTIQAELAGALAAAADYEPERRPFLPHVTVARVRVGAGRIRADELPAPPALAFAGSAVTLYRSRLGGGGARYEPLLTVAL